jgi:hypothetical protein
VCKPSPGARCAADTRQPCADTECEYRQAHPDGPAVGTLESARAGFEPTSERVELAWARRRTPAPVAGSVFGQHIEPNGRYLSAMEQGGSYPDDLYDTGTVTFQRPLRVPFGGSYAEADNWKRALCARYGGKTGRALSNAVLDDGYDAIITSDKYGTSEIVDLTEMAQARAWVTPHQLQDALKSRHPGLQLDLSRSPSGYVVVSRIVLPKGDREAGVGTRVMTDIMETADRNGWPLALTPSSDFGGAKGRLEQFYRRFGFVPNKGRAKDYETSESFLRPPRT